MIDITVTNEDLAACEQRIDRALEATTFPGILVGLTNELRATPVAERDAFATVLVVRLAMLAHERSSPADCEVLGLSVSGPVREPANSAMWAGIGGTALFRVIPALGLARSHGEARRCVREGRVFINGLPALDEGCAVHPHDEVTVLPDGGPMLSLKFPPLSQ